VYADLCFISVVHYCEIGIVFSYLALAALGIKTLVDIYYLLRTAWSKSMIDEVCYFAQLTQVYTISNMLDKWTNQ
jgi:hypothetical protein